MTDSRARSEVGALALARRLLGRVLDTVRGSDAPEERWPEPAMEPPRSTAPSEPRAALAAAPPRSPSVALVRVADLAPPPPEPARALAETDTSPDERVVSLPSAELAPPADEPARALLADASWSGVRHLEAPGHAMLAWRDVDAAVDTLRTVEIRCDFGRLDAAPEVTVTDRPASPTIGAISLRSDAAHLLVALGTLRGGRFVSRTHASLR